VDPSPPPPPPATAPTLTTTTIARAAAARYCAPLPSPASPLAARTPSSPPVVSSTATTSSLASPPLPSLSPSPHRPGVRPLPLHVCAFIEEVKRSQCKWMLDALQVYCLERLLARSHFTLRPEAAWVEFINDPVRTKVLPSQEAYELFTDAQASRVAGLVGDRGPDRGLNGRHSYIEWLRRPPCACGARDCDKSVDSVLFRCGLCTEARACLRSGMAAFASSCDPAYTGMGGWNAACMLLRGLTDVTPGQRLAARRLLLALPHAPPLNNVGVPIMGRRDAQRMGRQVHARVLDMFNAAESGRRRASQLLRHFPAISSSGPGMQSDGAAPSGRGQPPLPAAAVGVIRAVS
jgi:hypothetical protein